MSCASCCSAFAMLSIVGDVSTLRILPNLLVPSDLDNSVLTSECLSLDRRLIIMYTIPFNIPPTFENVVTNWKSCMGTSISDDICTIPYAHIAHHWIKNAVTNRLIVRAARWEARTRFASRPSMPLNLGSSFLILFQVRKYKMTFIIRINVNGTVVKNRLAISPVTPSK